MSFKPSATLAREDRLLTNVSLAYVNRSYIADQVLPTVNVKDDTGIIGGYSNDHLRIYSAQRSLYDISSNRLEFQYTQDKTYAVGYFDLEGYVPDRLRDQARQPFDAFRDMTVVTQQALMLEREKALADAMTDTAVLTSNETLSGGSQFDQYSTSEPEVKIRTARDSVFEGIGLEANTILMSRDVMTALQLHPFFLNQVRGVQRPSQNDVVQILKDFFGFTKVLIGSARYVSSEEGQTEAKANVWNKDIVVFHTPETPSLMTNSFGYSYQIADRQWKVTRRREPNANKGELISVEHARDDKILMPEAAYLIKDAVS